LYDVVVVMQPRRDTREAQTPEEGGWPSGFFEATAGAGQGEFVRDQGQFEEREALCAYICWIPMPACSICGSVIQG
jgi:hypothetical protein